MTRVIVSGAAGSMGSMVCAALEAEGDLELVGRYDPAGGLIADPADLPEADVVVEFTNPDVVMANLGQWRERGWHAVVGTSGFTTDRITEVEALFGAGPPNCLIVPNFSLGAVLAMRFAAEAAPHFSAAEIIELHHDGKADAPSGTAIATAARIADAASQSRTADSTELLPGARGASVDGVPVHSVRLSGLVAHQEVILGGTGETLTIRHDTTERRSFLPGVLLGIRRVHELPGVTVGLESLL
ncbi:MAG: 4-hydroxy-tetrahydrodipicolinate reductase [Acidimicrobiia bacterium]|nr:MAG: 4-hydroxy-tetrahydrodipicolinate reductase [Acidimicrobiia bacterium]